MSKTSLPTPAAIEKEIQQVTQQFTALDAKWHQDEGRLGELRHRQADLIMAGSDTTELDAELAALLNHVQGEERAWKMLQDKLAILRRDLLTSSHEQAVARIASLTSKIGKDCGGLYARLCETLDQVEAIEATYHELELLRKANHLPQSKEEYDLSRMISGCVIGITGAIEATPQLVLENAKDVPSPAELQDRGARKRNKWANENAIADQKGYAITAQKAAFQSADVQPASSTSNPLPKNGEMVEMADGKVIS
jgi:hypothetical protein